jgi:cyanate permease
MPQGGGAASLFSGASAGCVYLAASLVFPWNIVMGLAAGYCSAMSLILAYRRGQHEAARWSTWK